ncbi:MAG: YvcK family protein [Candidatus Woesebacteria bacterium]|jgi:uncharacterized cofD-like protein
MVKKVRKKKVVVIGGGTGTSVVLSGLKNEAKLDLTAIVAVFDSGGSTGRLRDEFGFLAVGDLRQCLAALADGRYQEDIRNLLLYRFNKGNGLKGHNLGNLILTALEYLSNSPAQAIETAARIFRINGRVYPITEKDTSLKIHYQDGTINIGEHTLDDSRYGGKRITKIELEPKSQIYKKAAAAIESADMIILGPGDLYASLLVNALPKGFKAALKENKGKFVYIVNLMTHYAQTHKMTAKDHLTEVIRYCGRRPDIVILNSEQMPADLAARYARCKEFPIRDDLVNLEQSQIIKAKLLSKSLIQQNKSDTVIRTLLRHDAYKLAKVLVKIVNP